MFLSLYVHHDATKGESCDRNIYFVMEVLIKNVSHTAMFAHILYIYYTIIVSPKIFISIDHVINSTSKLSTNKINII